MPKLETGGAERTTIDIAAALARSGYAAYVATREGRMLNELIDVGGRWIRFPADSKAPHTLVANAFRLRDIVRERKIALIHARSRAPAWSAFFAARMAKVPFVTTYHGIYNAKSGFKRFYNSVMARGDAVIANSEWTAAHIAAEYRFKPKHLAVIPRGVDFARFDPAGIPAERVEGLRRQWQAKPGETLVLLPGRLTRWKGQTILLDALARLKREGRLGAVHTVFAGDPQGRNTYEAELRLQIVSSGLDGAVHIAGHVNDMPAAYLAADIVVSASVDPEAFGRVAAEAGAMARPVIATNHGGAREVVLPGTSGLLVAPGDSAALADALATLLAAGPERREAMGKAARAHIAARYTVERMCADTLALYRELLGTRT
ncbi:MAG TPA: glycosyltransferase family 4 protein [Rhizomicrobium sp.]|nr:glycosyltransferase family 4 protein [Rhizomicrobium sp.]